MQRLQADLRLSVLVCCSQSKHQAWKSGLVCVAPGTQAVGTERMGGSRLTGEISSRTIIIIKKKKIQLEVYIKKKVKKHFIVFLYVKYLHTISNYTQGLKGRWRVSRSYLFLVKRFKILVKVQFFPQGKRMTRKT